MRQYDANPALSAFTVVVGGLLGVAVAVLLGLGGLGVLLAIVLGIALAGLLASSLGLVAQRNRPDDADDGLPPEYHDY
jgi:VIT1/CCC1 family predicted Fe2+/Mn2+ transporter